MIEKPFEYLLKLEQAVLARKPQLPSEIEIKQTWSGIGFSVKGQRMVVPLGEIVELIHPPSATRLPSVQGWVIGLANVRGRLLPLFDLEAFLGGKLSNNKVKHRVLILEIGELYAGLVVSEAYGMQHFSEDAPAVQLPESLTGIKDYTNGAYEMNGHVWTVFSPLKLISDPRFFNAAA